MLRQPEKAARSARPRLEQLSLRERKRAKTRLALLDAALQRLDERSLDDIPVKELCQVVQVSEPTFFNYFSDKRDLLTYFIQLWTIDMAWQAQRDGQSGLAAIEALFMRTASHVSEHPRVMLELIAHQIKMPKNKSLPGVGLAERLLYFGDHEGIEAMPAEGIDTIVPRQLEVAIARGELPADADVQLLMTTLVALFFGTPLLLAKAQPAALSGLYHQQLQLIWHGARASAPATKRKKRRS
jgi:AcrR family transcriptional regulator